MTLLQDVLALRPLNPAKRATLSPKEQDQFDRLFAAEMLTKKYLRGDAERFVFTEDIDSLRGHFEEHKISMLMLYKMLRHPAKAYWIEWPFNDVDNGRHFCRIGALVDTYLAYGGAGIPKTMVIFYAGGNNITSITAIFYMSDYVEERHGFDAVVIFGDETADMSYANLVSILTEQLATALFAINTPKVTEIVKVTHDAKLQKARHRRGKPPLIEYKRCTMLIGRKLVYTPRRPGESAEAYRRRMHQVIGHYRTYLHGRVPHMTWIEPHWRGDPKLGIVVHERTVRRPDDLPVPPGGFP